MATVPSLTVEKTWYMKATSCCNTIEELDQVPITRKRKKFNSVAGEPIDMEEIRDAVNKIIMLKNNLPPQAATLFDLTTGDLPTVSRF